MRVILDQGAVYTKVTIADASAAEITDALAIVRAATSAQPDGYRYAPSYKTGRWDGFIHLFKNGHFPSGLVPDVIRAFPKSTDLTVNNLCPLGATFPTTESMLNGITLRPYQLEAVRTLLPYRRGIARMATNSGKTEVFGALIKSIVGRAVVLVTKRDLLHQTRDRLAMRLDEPVGIIGDGYNELGTERVHVAMIQTLARWTDLDQTFADFHCMIADECHHVPSKTAQYVMLNIPAPMRYGFSGTPLHNSRLEDMLLVGATGQVLYEITNADLIESGVSATPHITMFVERSEGERGYRTEWPKAYNRDIVCNNERNWDVVEALNNKGYQAALVLVERIEHGKTLEGMIPWSRFVHGGMTTDARAEALQWMRTTPGAVVIATPIFDEGVDVPSVDLLVLAGGGKAPIRLLQRLGRGMRMAEGKTGLRVVDFVDDTNWYLLEHSMERAQVYEDEGFEVEIVE